MRTGPEEIQVGRRPAGGQLARQDRVLPVPPLDGGPMPQAVPNILVILADDIGWSDPSCYHQGLMGTRTPNIDRVAAEGARLTDCYAQASCTAGRAAFITGQLPMRTGLTT